MKIHCFPKNKPQRNKYFFFVYNGRIYMGVSRYVYDDDELGKKKKHVYRLTINDCVHYYNEISLIDSHMFGKPILETWWYAPDFKKMKISIDGSAPNEQGGVSFLCSDEEICPADGWKKNYEALRKKSPDL